MLLFIKVFSLECIIENLKFIFNNLFVKWLFSNTSSLWAITAVNIYQHFLNKTWALLVSTTFSCWAQHILKAQSTRLIFTFSFNLLKLIVFLLPCLRHYLLNDIVCSISWLIARSGSKIALHRISFCFIHWLNCVMLEFLILV